MPHLSLLKDKIRTLVQEIPNCVIYARAGKHVFIWRQKRIDRVHFLVILLADAANQVEWGLGAGASGQIQTEVSRGINHAEG